MNNWSAKKAALNHDWLRNGLLVLLGAVRNVSAGNVEDPTVVHRLWTEIDVWQEHRVEACQLIENFERDMSPRILFTVPPLSSCYDEDFQWLPGLAHASWLRRNPVHEWTEGAREAVDRVNCAFELLADCNPLSVESLRSFQCQRALERLAEAASTMAEAFVRLPNRILI